MSLPAPAPDQVVLVTGASSGIGSELARQLAALGHELVLVARRADRLDQLATALSAEHGVEALAVPTDLTDAEQRRALIASVKASEKFVAGLCNNAGFGSYGRVAETDPAHEAAMVQLNVAAVHELTLAFLRPMVERRAGAILNVASLAAFQPVPGMATYAATSSGASVTNPGTSDSIPSVPATSPNSVGTGPGASTVHDTPVPASSACSASENDCTNAFVAA